MSPDERARADHGLRFNTDKVGMELVPPEVVVAFAQVSTAGAKKYAPRNWEKGMSWMTLVGCAMRHQFKWLMGEEYDKETGLHHADMWLWNVGALVTYIKRGSGTDDRPATSKWKDAV